MNVGSQTKSREALVDQTCEADKVRDIYGYGHIGRRQAVEHGNKLSLVKVIGLEKAITIETEELDRNYRCSGKRPTPRGTSCKVALSIRRAERRD